MGKLKDFWDRLFGKRKNPQPTPEPEPTPTPTPVPVPEPEPKPVVTWYHWCNENETVEVPPNTLVRYGANDKWVEKVMSGTVRADNDTFGDPIHGTLKTLQATIEMPVTKFPANVTTGNTTPAAPGISASDTTNTLDFTHALGDSEIEVSVNGASYVPLTSVSGWNAGTGLIDVGDVDRAAGYWVARIKAATGRNASATTSSPAFTVAGNTTPAAPGVIADDTANTLDFTHALGDSEIEVSVNGAGYVAMTAVAGWNAGTGKIDVGNVARSAGYWVARIKAATGRNVSATVSSPAFTVAGGASAVVAYPALPAPVKPTAGSAAPGAPFVTDAAGSVAGTPPVINYVGSHNVAEAAPGEFFMVMGENMNTATSLHTWDGSALSTSGNGSYAERTMSIRNPAGGGWKFVVGWLSNSNGKSAPFFINKAKITWSNSKKYPGDVAWIRGVNLSKDKGTTTTTVALVKAGVETRPTVTSVSPYSVGFSTTGLSGTYEVWVHNNHGGDYGWSRSPNDLTVEQTVNWDNASSSTPTLSTAMTLAAAVSNRTNILAALAGGTPSVPKVCIIPTNQYYLARGFTVPQYSKLLGADRNSCILKLLPYTGVAGSTEADIIAARTSDAMLGLSNNCRVSGIQLSTNNRRLDGFGNYEPVWYNTIIGHTIEDVRLENMILDTRGTMFAPEIKIFFNPDDVGATCKQIEINNVNFIQSAGLHIEGEDISMTNVYCYGAHVVNQAIQFNVQRGSIVNGHGLNFGETLIEKAKGRFSVMGRPTQHVYYENITTVDYAPPGPDNGIDRTPLDFSAWGYKNNTSGTTANAILLNDNADISFTMNSGKSIVSGDYLHMKSVTDPTVRIKVYVNSYNSSSGLVAGNIGPSDREWYPHQHMTTLTGWTIEGALFPGGFVDTDDNGGEAILGEGQSCQWQNTGVTPVSPTQVTFPSSASTKFSSRIGAPGNTSQFVHIVRGKGAGYLGKIMSRSGLTVTLDRPMVTQPDASSVVVIGNYLEDAIFYNCSFDGNDRWASGFKATTSIEPYGGAFAWLADGLIVRRVNTGLFVYPLAPGSIDVMSPCTHMTFLNGNISDSYRGIGLEAGGVGDLGAHNSGRAAAAISAINFRDFVITGITTDALFTKAGPDGTDNASPKLFSGIHFHRFNFTPSTSFIGSENVVYTPAIEP